MTKKSKILYYSCLIVNVVCFILDFLPGFQANNFEFFRISFPVTLIVIGIWLLVRAFSLKIDSSMFIGSALLLCGAIRLVVFLAKKFGGVLLGNLEWALYLFALSIASLVTAIYFKDKFQFKLCVLFLGLGLIVLLCVQNLIPLWLAITLAGVWFVLYFVLNIVMFKRRKK